MLRIEEYGSRMVRLFPQLHPIDNNGERVLTRTVTFQTTNDCSLRCSYCYQIQKGHDRMSLEIGKKFVDLLLNATPENNPYINPIISPFIILDFIGGEPLLEAGLMDQIVDYFIEQAFQKQHPWADKFMISISSNGTEYFKPEVQKFLLKHRQHLSLSITIDGNKELHDSCRVFPDGSPSYNIAVQAALHWMKFYHGYMGSKITIAPENVHHLYNALVHMVELGYTEINANCVYEDVWNQKDATVLYKQMKQTADYLLHTDKEIFCSLFDDFLFHKAPEADNQNYCGGTGFMLSCDPKGYLYPCIRYMESSLGNDQPPIIIGHVDTGIATTHEEQETVKCLQCITRRSQSTDECYECPIGTGCGWCSALNYQMFGTANKRSTAICEMHKARSLANVYYWNKVYAQNGELDENGKPKKFKMHCPKEWAIPIIGEEEYVYLLELSGGNENED